jgi:hypothetical protein
MKCNIGNTMDNSRNAIAFKITNNNKNLTYQQIEDSLKLIPGNKNFNLIGLAGIGMLNGEFCAKLEISNKADYGDAMRHPKIKGINVFKSVYLNCIDMNNYCSFQVKQK